MTAPIAYYRYCISINAVVCLVLFLGWAVYLASVRDAIHPVTALTLQCGCRGVADSCGFQTDPALCAVCEVGLACVNQVCQLL